jgi:uncharacterized protein (TIGR02757 family)
MLRGRELKLFLDEKVARYNTIAFIEHDPISVPHQYTKRQDIEIAALFAAVLAWGQRVTIVKKSKELMQLMDNSPHEFIVNHGEGDLKRLMQFKHRTFNGTDALYFVHFLNWYYSKNSTLEDAFLSNGNQNVGDGISGFHRLFFSLPDFPARSRKHIATPERNSACKRINMFLRWMVRRDEAGVDFGIWDRLSPSTLICPCDMHVERVARTLGLIQRKQLDWLTAEELTGNLRELDRDDPVKYDFALFGLGIEGRL